MGEKSENVGILKTATDISAEVDQLVNSIVGKVNALDSKNDRANIVQSVINTVVAGVELSRIEKVGILYIVTNSRVKTQ